MAPALTITGPVESMPIEVAVAMLAVCQEALANIARHAGATHCQVEVHVGQADVTLYVRDDGRGMPAELPHTSGVENIVARARALDGAARWEPRAPHGTMLVWTVPMTAVDAPRTAAPEPVE